MEWELIDSMPSRLFDEFLTKPGGMYFDCAGNGGCVYFINYEKPPMLIVFDVISAFRFEDGTLVNLRDFKYKLWSFFSADHTPAYTPVSYQEFKKAGAGVIG
ncbi:hypothetical protein SELMODRAFT_422208 [Selaginella moellendorffii]|uniref:Uncharacterized protein n=1 Tax=Selaginella moellendorffii TaxID=88036 RepID=D8SHQ4_SELML|nr:hypothetical protein SELMODRAFT_422208 [Selaginella moellendorffii]